METKEPVFTVELSSDRAEVTVSQTQAKEQSSNGLSHNHRASTSSSVSAENQSRLVSALYWLCGMERRREEHAPPPPEPPVVCSLEEKSHLKTVVNINLIVALTVTVFIIGYWA